jgi:hypothetical protein
MARCYVVPADDQFGHAGQQWCTDDQGNFWQRREGVDPPVGGGSTPTPPQQPATPSAPAGSAGTATPTNSLPAGISPETALAARQLADNSAQIAYLNKKLELDRTQGQQLDERERIRLAQEAAAQAWKQTYERETLNQSNAKLMGYSQMLGPGTGAKINAAGEKLRADPAYQAVAQRATAGDQQALAQLKQMQIAEIANQTGLPVERATALHAALAQRRDALGGRLMSAEDIDRFVAQSPDFQAQTLEREQYGTDTALKYLQLRSQMRGPENAFAYAAALRDTPESVRNLINQAAGRANLPGLAVPAPLTGPASAGVLGPGSMNYSTQGGTPAQAGAVMSGVDPRPGAAQGEPMRSAAVVPQTGAGGTGFGTTAPGTMNYQRQGGTLGQPVQGPNARSQVDPTTGLLRSSAWNPQEIQRTGDYQKKLLLAGYEAAGADKDAVLDEYKRSLPRYSGALRGRIAA